MAENIYKNGCYCDEENIEISVIDFYALEHCN